jgi:hypothetical protein
MLRLLSELAEDLSSLSLNLSLDLFSLTLVSLIGHCMELYIRQFAFITVLI